MAWRGKERQAIVQRIQHLYLQGLCTGDSGAVPGGDVGANFKLALLFPFSARFVVVLKDGSRKRLPSVSELKFSYHPNSEETSEDLSTAAEPSLC